MHGYIIVNPVKSTMGLVVEQRWTITVIKYTNKLTNTTFREAFKKIYSKVNRMLFTKKKSIYVTAIWIS